MKGIRKAGVRTLPEANQYLEQEYLPLWNSRFTLEPANPTDAHRPLGREHDLAAILSHVESRVVANDYTIRYDKKIYQIARAEIRPGLRAATVRVEERLDQSLWVRFRDRYLAVGVCESPPKTPAPAPVPKLRPSSPSKPGSTWMKGFNLQKSLPVWKIMRQEQEGRAATERGP